MNNLRFLAGRKAFAFIRENGLQQENVKVIAGASGGAKWLVLNQMDRFLFGDWFENRKEPLFAVGSSIGTWRFAAMAQKNPLEAIQSFQTSYIGQQYPPGTTRADITQECKKILDHFVKSQEILNHPYLRLSILSARSRYLVKTEKKVPLSLGLGCAAILNAFSRRNLRLFFERTLFYDPRDPVPFFNLKDFPTSKIPLNEQNVKSALQASGSIPLLMNGVKDISGAPAGLYWDGGLIDYHLDLPFLKNNSGIVLYPHFLDRVIPGWFDKKLRWRQPTPSNMDPVLLISPTQEFLNRLPQGKIPDRKDFWLFQGKDKERIAYWKQVVEEGKRLAEDFQNAVQTNKIKELVEPM